MSQNKKGLRTLLRAKALGLIPGTSKKKKIPGFCHYFIETLPPWLFLLAALLFPTHQPELSPSSFSNASNPLLLKKPVRPLDLKIKILSPNLSIHLPCRVLVFFCWFLLLLSSSDFTNSHPFIYTSLRTRLFTLGGENQLWCEHNVY